MIPQNELNDKITNLVITAEANNTIQKLVSKIPPTFHSIERVSYLIELLSTISHADKESLIKTFNNLLKVMIDMEASDIELGGYGSNGFVWYRIYGIKEPLPELPKFSHDESALLILSILNEKQRRNLEENRNLDFSYTFDYVGNKYIKDNDSISEIRFRGDAYFDVDRLALNMRSIIPKLRSLEELGFHSNTLKALSYSYIKQGLVLITGITGSGKSTSLDAIVNWHNNNVNAHIVTIASPLEFVHKSNKCIIRQREVGRDVNSFQEGVIQALRQDLDIMIIGEMRDPETILAALEVTDTGHKVFSTLHTSSAVESIDRIVAEVNESEQERVRLRLADVLTAIISQKLIPSLDGKLILAKEVLIVNQNIRAAIKNNNTGEIYMMINQSASEGMITLEQDLKRLYLEQKISLESAMQFANNKPLFEQIIGSNI